MSEHAELHSTLRKLLAQRAELTERHYREAQRLDDAIEVVCRDMVQQEARFDEVRHDLWAQTRQGDWRVRYDTLLCVAADRIVADEVRADLSAAPPVQPDAATS